MRRSATSKTVAQGFSLIELLVVIAIIGILAGLILSSLSIAKTRAMMKMAKVSEVSLVSSINAYYATYSRLPASTQAVSAAGTNDFTFGTVAITPAYSGTINPLVVQTPGESIYQNYNSEVIAILNDNNFWPEANAGNQHIYNPQQTSSFTAPISQSINSPGIGPDYVFRDPWGDPFIVTLDLNYDHQCYDATLDAMYQLQNPKPAGPLLIPGSAVVWSFGPSKTVNIDLPLNSSYNTETLVTSWSN